MNKISMAILAALCFGLAGCASITGSEMQQISLTTVDTTAQPIQGVSCKFQNDKGSWEATSPSFVNIRRSAEDMNVECNKNGHPTGLLKAVSRAGGDMYGNIIFGGGIGALIDHNKGNGYNYPDLFTVELGKSVIADRKTQNDAAREKSSVTPSEIR